MRPLHTFWKLSVLATLLVVGPVLAQEIPQAIPSDVGMSPERLEQVTNMLQSYVDDERLPGAVTMVLRRGSVVYAEAVGSRDLEARAPMEVDAIFRIASQTKALVSVGIMILQEEGKLHISDPVSRYLPSFSHTTVAVPLRQGGYEVREAERVITLRHLLTHTAGIGYGGWNYTGPDADEWSEAGITGWYFGHREEPVRNTVDRMPELPFRAQPGEAWVYGYNTDILGAVIEEVSGLSLDAFLRSRVLDPLEMWDTHFYLPEEKRHRLATVYNLPPGGQLSRAAEGPGMETQGQYIDGPRASFSGGAGLLSTARDYSRFLQMLLNRGELNGVRILSPTTVALMTQNHVGDLYQAPGMGFGLGFAIRLDVGEAGEPGSLGSFRWAGAYHSTYWVDPAEDLVVVYLTQVIPASGLDEQRRLRALVYSSIVQ